LEWKSSIMIDQYHQLVAQFRWNVPEHFNIAQACCHRWIGNANAIEWTHHQALDNIVSLNYATLSDHALRLATALRAGTCGEKINVGDRVAIILPQRPESAIAHMAVYSLGAIAVPLTTQFGPDALRYRLNDSAASIAIVAASELEKLQSIVEALPALRGLIIVNNWVENHAATENEKPSFNAGYEAGGLAAKSAYKPHSNAPSGVFLESLQKITASSVNINLTHFNQIIDQSPPLLLSECAHTKATDPAIIIYTSGTTGNPKGALLPHCALLGNLPGFTLSHNDFPQSGDKFWSPADWAWTGGLMDALLPTLYFGRTLVAHEGRFDGAKTFEILQRFNVRNAFIFPTALKMMMKQVPHPSATYRVQLRSLMSGGEAVGAALYEWAQRELGVTINEIFGQTEINYIVGNSHHYWPIKPGAMGRPYPGHRIALLNDNDEIVPLGEYPNEVGDVALHTHWNGEPNPIFFLGYWNNLEATQAKYTIINGERWCRTGDLARQDADGTLWYCGRADDVFKAAGYRIGPSEIEDCLVRHESVANAAVVPAPDETRGNLVAAFIVLAQGFTASDALVEALQNHVRQTLAPYQVPKRIEFIDALSMTTTGKVQRRVLRERLVSPVGTSRFKP
jgi:acetyl-CoA synthetase